MPSALRQRARRLGSAVGLRSEIYMGTLDLAAMHGVPCSTTWCSMWLRPKGEEELLDGVPSLSNSLSCCGRWCSTCPWLLISALIHITLITAGSAVVSSRRTFAVAGGQRKSKTKKKKRSAICSCPWSRAPENFAPTRPDPLRDDLPWLDALRARLRVRPVAGAGSVTVYRVRYVGRYF